MLVRHTDQIEQDITEPFPEVELRTESVAPQMDPIEEEAEDDGHADDEVCGYLCVYLVPLSHRGIRIRVCDTWL